MGELVVLVVCGGGGEGVGGGETAARGGTDRVGGEVVDGFRQGIAAGEQEAGAMEALADGELEAVIDRVGAIVEDEDLGELLVGAEAGGEGGLFEADGHVAGGVLGGAGAVSYTPLTLTTILRVYTPVSHVADPII